MLDGIALWEILRETFNWRGPHLDEVERHRMIRQLVGLMVTDMLTATDIRLKESKVKSALDIQKLKHNVIGYSEDMQRRNRELKDFLYKKLYRHYRVVRMSVRAERLISDLFNGYKAEPAILPDHVQRIIEKHGLERTICDLSENADYHKAKEDQGFLEGRIKELEAILRNAVIIEKSEDHGVVAIGSEVTIQEDGLDPETYYLVGPTEADPRKGRISHESPIGRAIIDKKVGDIAEAETPGGKIKFKIVKIE